MYSPCLSLSLRLRLRHATPRSLHNPKIKREAWFVGLVVARFSYRYLYWRAGGGHILCTRCMLEGLAVAMFSYVLFWWWPGSHFFQPMGGELTPPKQHRKSDEKEMPAENLIKPLDSVTIVTCVIRCGVCAVHIDINSAYKHMRFRYTCTIL